MSNVLRLAAIPTLLVLGAAIVAVASPTEPVTVEYLHDAILVLIGVAVVAGFTLRE